MSDEIKNEDEVLTKEDPTQIDDKEKLGAFVLKNVLLYWKRVVVMIVIVGGVVLLMSGYSCAEKNSLANDSHKLRPSFLLTV